MSTSDKKTNVKCGREKVIFDTDIGGDPDDALALMYLLREPRCDLLGITTVGRNPQLKAEIASALCHSLGRGDVPVVAGLSLERGHLAQGISADEPPAPRQPAPQYTWRDELTKWPHDEPPADLSAIDFIRHAIRENPGEVTLLSTAPFTNVAALFAAAPEAPSLLKRLVLMGGHFGGEYEYNAFSDVAAAKTVFEGGGLPPPPELVVFGADATTPLSMSPEEGRQFMAQSPDFAFIRGWHAENWYRRVGRLYFHDPMAAVAIFHPEIATYTASAISVDDNDRAMTRKREPSGGNAWVWHIATEVDSAIFLSCCVAVVI